MNAFSFHIEHPPSSILINEGRYAYLGKYKMILTCVLNRTCFRKIYPLDINNGELFEYYVNA